MKNLKKVLAFVLAFAMVLSTMTVTFAAETAKNADKAQALNALGLFDGMSTDEFVPNLEGQLTREQAMKLMCDIFGWDVDKTATSEFEDVAAWAQPYVAAAVEKGVTNGIGNGKFGGSQSATLHQLLTWFLRELGYENAYDNAAAEALEAGLIQGAELVDFNGEVNRDALVGVAYKTLTTTPVGETETVIEKLVAAGKVDADVAAAKELYKKPAAPAVAVESVDPVNYVRTRITFNQKVDKDSAEDTGNYKIGKKEITEATLLEDGATVELKHAKTDTQGKYKVEVDGVKSADEATTVKDYVKEDVEYLDITIPEVEGVEAIGTKTIKVTFSEPMESAKKSAFTVLNDKSKKLYVNKAIVQNDNTVVYVTVYKSLEAGDYTIKVNGDVLDFAGYSVKPAELDFSVAKDEDGPVCVGYKDESKTGVTLIFDEPLDEDAINGMTTDELKDVYHTNRKNPACGVTASGTELKIAFKSDNEMPAGTAYVFVASDKLKDLWGNEAKTIMEEVNIEKDETAPTIADLSAPKENQIKIEFSEDVDSKTAKDRDNYEIKDADDNTVKISTIKVSGKDVTLTFSDDLSGVYTVSVNGVEDKSENKAEDVGEIEVTDSTAPILASTSAVVYNPEKDDQKIIVTFPEKMATEGKYSVLDLDKYIYGGKSLSKYDADITIESIEDGKAVEIKIPSEEEDKDNGLNISTGSNNLTIARVADANGNFTTDFSAQIDIDGKGTVNYKTAEATAKDTIVITFDGVLTTVEEDDFVVFVTGTNTVLDTASSEVGEDSDGNTTLTITLNNDLTAAAKATDTAIAVKTTGSAVESCNEYGEPVVSSDTAIHVVDKIAPTVEEKDDVKTVTYGAVTFDKDGANETTYCVLNVKLTEDIKGTSNPLASSDLVVSLDGDKLVYGTDYKFVEDASKYDNANIAKTTNFASQSDNFSIVILKDDYKGIKAQTFEGVITVQLDDSVNYIKDVAGNKIEELDVEADFSDLH